MKKIIPIGLILIMVSAAFLATVFVNVSASPEEGWSFATVDTPVSKEFYGVAWNPDGSYALIVGADGTILKYDGVSSPTSVSSGTTADLYSVAWKPDGSYALIVGEAKKILKYDGTTVTSLQTTDTDFVFSDITWRLDGSYALIVGDWNSVLWYGIIEKTTTGSDLSSVDGVQWERQRAVDWKPDQTYALIVGFGGDVHKYDGNTLSSVSSGRSEDFCGVDWKTDGSTALIAGHTGKVVKYDGATFTQLSSPTTAALHEVCWRPDGSYALICGDGGWVMKCDGDTVSTLSSGVTKDLNDISWNSAGNCALLVGNQILLKYSNPKPTAVTLSSPTYITSNYVELSWSQNTDSDFSEYEVHKSTASGFTPSTTTLVATITSKSTTYYIVTDLSERTTYYFKIKVIDTINQYTDSNQVSATTSNGPPTAVTLSSPTAITNSSMTISWTQNTNDDFSKYEIHKSTSSGFTTSSATLYTTITSQTTISTPVSGLFEATTYYFKVRVIDTGGLYTDSNQVSATTSNAAPTAVTLNTPNDITNSAIGLSWMQNTNTDFSKYEIHKSTTSGFTPSTTTLVTTITTKSTTAYTVSDLSELTTYYFKIRVIDTGGLYTNSNQVSATTSNAAPTAVTLTTPSDITNSAIGLSWMQNTNTDFSKYEIHKSTTSGFTPSSATLYTTITSQTITSTTVSGLIEGTTYYFKVRTIDSGGLYTDSNEASGTTTKPDTSLFYNLIGICAIIIIVIISGIAVRNLQRKRLKKQISEKIPYIEREIADGKAKGMDMSASEELLREAKEMKERLER